jgi:23S rRNA-/tRNA-specific pseudouridylate synthase
MEPTIIFEDNDIFVLNKPSGMTVNSADTTKDEMTVQGWLEEHKLVILSPHPVILNDSEGSHSISKFSIERDSQNDNKNVTTEKTYNIVDEFNNRGGIVHRLDKETSGALIVAKNAKSFGALKEQFMSRIVRKTYLALAHGKIVPEEGEINAPIGRQEFNRMRFGVVAGGREAVTEYKVVMYYHVIPNLFRDLPNNRKMLKRVQHDNQKNDSVFSLVELHPKTGRTHQIRVHLKYINHPIVSDPLYLGRKEGREDRKHLNRLFLHASSITFTHPTTQKEMHIECPLPQELKEFVDKLRVMQ